MGVKLFVGTSGWSYPWNPDGIGWYSASSGLNAVELNASFYRFPFPSMVRGWARRGELRWSVKVHRSVTHVRRLKGPGALEALAKFMELFKPMDEAGLVDFYLFQLPPTFRASAENWDRIAAAAEASGLGERMAVEWREPGWFSGEWIDRARGLGITLVSMDSPDFEFYARSSRSVYLRLHGRSAWYAHDYGEEELEEIAGKALGLGGDSIYAFFNNDHAMLDNARRMLKILRYRAGEGIGDQGTPVEL